MSKQPSAAPSQPLSGAVLAPTQQKGPSQTK